MEQPVCHKAFLFLHGITGGRVKHIQDELKRTGSGPLDNRGKHKHRPRKISVASVNKIIEHIKSFKSRSSHYSLNKTKRVYLPAELNIMKMYKMFEEKYPDVTVSYEKYREIFNTKFNIAFGYPKTDTCSYCDTMKARTDSLKSEAIVNGSRIKKTSPSLQELHMRKAQAFYSRKRSAELEAQGNDSKVAIAMDFQKNLPAPNISTNDV